MQEEVASCLQSALPYIIMPRHQVSEWEGSVASSEPGFTYFTSLDDCLIDSGKTSEKNSLMSDSQSSIFSARTTMNRGSFTLQKQPELDSDLSAAQVPPKYFPGQPGDVFKSVCFFKDPDESANDFHVNVRPSTLAAREIIKRRAAAGQVMPETLEAGDCSNIAGERSMKSVLVGCSVSDDSISRRSTSYTKLASAVTILSMDGPVWA